MIDDICIRFHRTISITNLYNKKISRIFLFGCDGLNWTGAGNPARDCITYHKFTYELNERFKYIITSPDWTTIHLELLVYLKLKIFHFTTFLGTTRFYAASLNDDHRLNNSKLI